jgi:hypothetical protein
MPSREKLIHELLEETIRARRRRLNITSSLDVRLLGLKTVDSKLDRNIRALSIFGEDAIDAAVQQLVGLTHEPTADALVHIIAACAVQATSTSNQPGLLERLQDLYGQKHRSALRDAWWFYPLNRRSFDLHLQHITALLQSRQADHQLMAIEVAGRLGMRACAPKLMEMLASTTDHTLRHSIELALCRMGAAPDNLPKRIQTLAHGTSADVLHALRLIASSGQLKGTSTEQLLAWTKSAQLPVSGLAWCLATISNPAAAHKAALSTQIDPDLRIRILALAGFPSGLISIVREITEQNIPATPAQLDALATLLDEVPAEVNAKPVDVHKREDALRTAVLKAFRAAHIPVSNEAKVCEWSAQAMLAEPHSQQGRRLRYGAALRPKESGGVALGLSVPQMGPLMRQALYIEQSVQAGRPIGAGLSAYANSRHQLDVIGISQWLGQVNAQSVQAA